MSFKDRDEVVKAWSQRMIKMSVIKDAHIRAIERKTMSKAERLTPTQMSILESGMHQPLFMLTAQQRGKASAILEERGLIMVQPMGQYTLTSEGRKAYKEAEADLAGKPERKAKRGGTISSSGVVALAKANEIITGIHRLMAADGSDLDPVEYVACLRRKAELVDQYSFKIEALTRRIEDLSKAVR